jgi:hypothetical protein
MFKNYFLHFFKHYLFSIFILRKEGESLTCMMHQHWEDNIGILKQNACRAFDYYILKTEILNNKLSAQLLHLHFRYSY